MIIEVHILLNNLAQYKKRTILMTQSKSLRANSIFLLTINCRNLFKNILINTL
jgi:hypothetical protein